MCGGSPGWSRTSNLPVNSRLLCQLSYRGSSLQRFTVYLGPGALPAFVAGAGFEPAHRRLMRAVPSQLGHPALVAPDGADPSPPA